MRIIERYIAGSFLSTWLGSLCIFTFVLSIAGVFRAVDMISRGASGVLILSIFMHGLPVAMSFAVPLSVLVSSLLVFERLSADGEIIAMRAGGMSIRRCVVPVLGLALGLALVCAAINQNIAPHSQSAQRAALRQLATRYPVELLEEGRYIREIPGFTIYVGKKRKNHLENVRINQDAGNFQREITARSGVAHVGGDGQSLVLELRDVRIDPVSPDSKDPAYAESWTLRIANLQETASGYKKKSDMDFGELMAGIRAPQSLYPDAAPDVLHKEQMTLRVELNKRFSLAAASFAFALLGIPLGIKQHRKESTLGVAISLGLAFLFYLLLTLAESLRKQPHLMPDLIMWAPAVLCMGVGWYMMRRADESA